ncbi:MAG: hypothetical protein ACI35S_04420 [Anaeroplasma sp.]
MDINVVDVFDIDVRNTSILFFLLNTFLFLFTLPLLNNLIIIIEDKKVSVKYNNIDIFISVKTKIV